MVCFFRAVIVNAPLDLRDTPAFGEVSENVPLRVAVSAREHFLLTLQVKEPVPFNFGNSDWFASFSVGKVLPQVEAPSVIRP